LRPAQIDASAAAGSSADDAADIAALPSQFTTGPRAALLGVGSSAGGWPGIGLPGTDLSCLPSADQCE
jgi:hypothetical protein